MAIKRKDSHRFGLPSGRYRSGLRSIRVNSGNVKTIHQSEMKGGTNMTKICIRTHRKRSAYNRLRINLLRRCTKKHNQVYRTIDGELKTFEVQNVAANGYRIINLNCLQKHISELTMHAVTCEKARQLVAAGRDPIILESQVAYYGLANTYQVIENEINYWWKEVVDREMSSAIEEEKKIAIDKNRYHERNTVESDKEQHNKDMITVIREQKKNPKNDFKKVEKKSSDGEENTDMNTLKRKHGEQYTRSRNPKLHIGWQHYKAGRYKQVFKADGGSVQQLPISTLDLEIDDVILLGTGVFYPHGKSKYGHLKEMEMYLADASGQKLTFERVNETKPNLGNYLRLSGLQLSKCTFYLMTKLRKDQSFISKNERTGISLHDQSSSCVFIQSDNFITAQQDLVSNKTRSLEQQQAISNQPQRTILLPVDVCGTVKERQEIVIRYYRERLSKYSEETMQIGGKDFIDTKFERNRRSTEEDDPISLSRSQHRWYNHSRSS
ncbi:unnamed protein product [Mytilus coruscus]|uniref:Uncharacterized protein n=1 Tax=Mytilus coruscus TaxID=42192 RepID=A0A6J8AYG4_MYTCO|nr:unnamed protein product [Mytilus coruscus]